MPWYCVEINESYLLGGTFHQLCRDFQRAFMDAGGPEDMALFAETDPEEDLRRVYFSPGSSAHVKDLIDEHQGYYCQQPEANEITLLFGIPNALSVLFAGAPPAYSASSTKPYA